MKNPMEVNLYRWVFWVFIILFAPCSPDCAAADKQDFPLNPVLNQGKKWRIAYYEGGPYTNYPDNLKALAIALSDIGWLNRFSIPDFSDRSDTTHMWQWLCHNIKSDYIQFVSDAYWSGNWNENLRKHNRSAALKRMNKTKDIDLMLAMGTWAGQDFANNEHAVPTVVISASNPINSGIARSVNDSGFDHLNARVDPARYQLQLKIFYNAFHFKKLGLVYDMETSAGKSYASIDDVKKSAAEHGYEIITCHAPSANTSMREAKDGINKCYTEIAAKVDAVYITAHRGMTLDNLPVLLAPLNAKGIPTFSQQNSEEVRYGVLMSISQACFKYVARYHAETIAKIFNGAKARDLPQLFEDPLRIALNLKTAAIIGYNPPMEILDVTDEIFEEIQVSQAKTE